MCVVSHVDCHSVFVLPIINKPTGNETKCLSKVICITIFLFWVITAKKQKKKYEQLCSMTAETPDATHTFVLLRLQQWHVQVLA